MDPWDHSEYIPKLFVHTKVSKRALMGGGRLHGSPARSEAVHQPTAIGRVHPHPAPFRLSLAIGYDSPLTNALNGRA